MRHLFARRRRGRGQSLAEFTLILPIIMTLTLTIAEFGVAFGTNMTMVEATREGARTGAVLVDGSKALGCGSLTGDAYVDPQIIAAVQRAIESPGSGISISHVDYIHIFKADANGNETSSVNVWKPWSSGHPTTTICGVTLDFYQYSNNWPASTRANILPVDSIGVSIQYEYQPFTPLSALTRLVGLSQITMVDSTVMALEP